MTSLVVVTSQCRESDGTRGVAKRGPGRPYFPDVSLD